MSTQISRSRLQQIIKEETQAYLAEGGVDHAAIRDIVTVASKLLAVVETFRKDANGNMLAAVSPQIDQIEKALENMVSTPASYVEKKLQAQHVTLRSDKKETNVV